MLICKLRIDSISDPTQTEGSLSINVIWWIENGKREKKTGEFSEVFNVKEVNRATIEYITDQIKLKALAAKDMAIIAKDMGKFIGQEFEIKLTNDDD